MSEEEGYVTECTDMAAIIAGSVVATFAVCTIVAGVIIYYMWRKLQHSKLRRGNGRNGVHRNHSMAGSVEAGLHNSAYVGDITDSNDVIMMMASKQVEEERRINSGKRRVVPSIYKHLDCVEVSLIGKEISGLGFDVQGNPRDGISISNIAERGAAKETQQMKVGDKVMSLTICFDNMVYEDALTLLSYASPYPITMTLGRKRKDKTRENGTLKSTDTARRKPKAQDSDSGTVSAARSPDLSENQSEISRINEVSSLDRDETSSAFEEDTDDDTKIRAPEYLPQSIKSLVESKKSGREAVEAIEDQTRDQILSPSTLESDHGIELSEGAQCALELILSQQLSDTVTVDS